MNLLHEFLHEFLSVKNVISHLMAAVFGLLVDAMITRRRERKILETFPLLQELEEGQVVTIGLKNGDRLTDVVFLGHFHLRMMIGTECEFNAESGEVVVSNVRWVKLSKMASIDLLEVHNFRGFCR